MNILFNKIVSSTLNISERQVENTIRLLDEGATIPFISRYRKERITAPYGFLFLNQTRHHYDKTERTFPGYDPGISGAACKRGCDFRGLLCQRA